MPTIGTPPVDIDSAQYRYGELSVLDEVHLIKKVADLEALGLEPDIYDEDWFADFDLLLIALPGITSHERLDVSVGQGAVALAVHAWVDAHPDASLEEAREAGIPVIAFDREVDVKAENAYTAWLGSDFYLDEGLMAKLMSRWEEPAADEYDILYRVSRV